MKTLTKTLIISAVAAAGVAAALPGIASADCYRRSENGTTGAIVGAIAGGAIGNAASGRHDRGAGTAAGAVLGAVVGSSIARDGTHCYYDGDGYARSGYYGDGYARSGYYGGDDYYRETYYRPAPRPYAYERVYVEAPPPPPPPYVRERVYVAAPPPPVYYGYGYHYRHRGW